MRATVPYAPYNPLMIVPPDTAVDGGVDRRSPVAVLRAAVFEPAARGINQWGILVGGIESPDPAAMHATVVLEVDDGAHRQKPLQAADYDALYSVNLPNERGLIIVADGVGYGEAGSLEIPPHNCAVMIALRVGDDGRVEFRIRASRGDGTSAPKVVTIKALA